MSEEEFGFDAMEGGSGFSMSPEEPSTSMLDDEVSLGTCDEECFSLFDDPTKITTSEGEFSISMVEEEPTVSSIEEEYDFSTIEEESSVIAGEEPSCSMRDEQSSCSTNEESPSHDINEASTSMSKKRKSTTEEPAPRAYKKFAVMEDSDDEHELRSDDDNVIFGTDNSEDSDGSTDNDTNQPSTSRAKPKRRSVPTADDLNEIEAVSVSHKYMKIFRFTRAHSLLYSPGSEPFDYFRAICDDDVLQLMVNETNRHAAELIAIDSVGKRPRLNKWRDLTLEEMMRFIALVIHTGTIQVHRVQDYWKRHPLFNLSCFSKHMSRDRFMMILRCLCFGENTDDHLDKINPIVNIFNEKMAQLYCPGKELSVESKLLWKGKDKHGIMLFMLTEPCGIVVNSTVYSGLLDDTNKQKAILNLISKYLGTGHSLYLDSDHNSYELVYKLTNSGTYCTGTLNRKCKHSVVQQIKKKQIDTGKSISFTFKNGIMVGKWKKHRETLYISNQHANKMTEYNDRGQAKKRMPLPMYFYKKYMNGVDRRDQQTAYHPSIGKTLKWYKMGSIDLIHRMLYNSFLIYKQQVVKPLLFSDFRIVILQKLLKVNPRTVSKPRKTSHCLTKITTFDKRGCTHRKRCRVCSQNKIRKMSIYHCLQCPDEPGLCVGECFDKFHAPISNN